MDLDFDPDIMAAVSIRRDLEGHPLEADAIISIDCPLEVFTEDVINISSYPGNKGGPFFEGSLFKLGIEGAQIDLGQVPIRLVYVSDAMKS